MVLRPLEDERTGCLPGDSSRLAICQRRIWWSLMWIAAEDESDEQSDSGRNGRKGWNYGPNV